MRRTLSAIAAAVLLAGLTACGGTEASAAACERAVREMVPTAMAGTDLSDAAKPKACDGLSDAELEAIGEKVVGSMFAGDFGDPEPEPTAGLEEEAEAALAAAKAALEDPDVDEAEYQRLRAEAVEAVEAAEADAS